MPSWTKATHGMPTRRAASPSSSIGTPAARCHRLPSPVHGADGAATPDRVSAISPSGDTCIATICTSVSTRAEAAERHATSMRAARSPGSIRRRSNSVSTTSRRGSGTRLRGVAARSRWRRRTPTSIRIPAASIAACSSRIGDGASGAEVRPGRLSLAVASPTLGSAVVLDDVLGAVVDGVVASTTVGSAQGESTVPGPNWPGSAGAATMVALGGSAGGGTDASAGASVSESGGTAALSSSGRSSSQPGRIRSGSSNVRPAPMSAPAFSCQICDHSMPEPSSSSAMSHSVSPGTTTCTSLSPTSDGAATASGVTAADAKFAGNRNTQPGLR